MRALTLAALLTVGTAALLAGGCDRPRGDGGGARLAAGESVVSELAAVGHL